MAFHHHNIHRETGPRAARIFYMCPDTQLQSAGIRRLYRHVALLCKAGFNAAIMHFQTGFRRNNSPDVPISYLDKIALDSDSVVVVPEGQTAVMDALKTTPCRRFVIALNWDYIYKNLPNAVDWRSFNIERVLAISPVIAKMISWAMDIPVHRISSSIDHQRYRYIAEKKQPQLTYIQRKGINIDPLKRILGARNKDFIHKIKWVGLDGMSEDEYAEEICKSAIFLNTSMAEGYPTSCLEAMAAGAVVVGYDAVGGRDILCGRGPDKNSVLVPNGDYVSLAYAMEPVLTDAIRGQMEPWSNVIANGLNITSDVTLERENDTLISFWEEACGCS